MTLEATFGFQAQARPIEQRSKFRVDHPCMITVDPRVFRGSTFRRNNQPPKEEAESERQPRKIFKKPRDTDASTGSSFPTSVQTKINIATETDKYLQEPYVKPTLDEIDTQTDAFLDRPVSPSFIPKKNGEDMEIQVVEGDLFDFDFEVQPIVHLIVTKLLEQSFLEVSEEAELEEIARTREEIQRERDIALAEIQRMEACERRKLEEKLRRLEERRVQREKDLILKLKISAHGFAGFITSTLYQDAISQLEIDGYFYDEIEKEIDEDFLPWVSQGLNLAKKENKIEFSLEQLIIRTTKNSEAQRRIEFNFKQAEKESDEQVQRQAVLRMMYIEDRAAQKIQEINLELKNQKLKSENEENEE